MKKRPGDNFRETTRLEKLLQLQGEAFVKRPPKHGGQIEGGWKLETEGETEDGREVVVLTKQEGGKERVHHAAAQEVARLNTGRNRAALEYIFSLPDQEARGRLPTLVDQADQNEQAREFLRQFFEQAALRLAHQQFEGMRKRKADIAPMQAKTMGELADYIKEAEQWFLEAVDQMVNMAKSALAQERSKKRPDPVEIDECEHDLKKASGERRRAEGDWAEKIRPILAAIDLAQQFYK